MMSQDDDRILEMLKEDASAGLGDDDPGPEYWNQFAGRVRSRVAREELPARRRWWRPLLGLAAVAAAGALIMVLLNPPAERGGGPNVEITQIDVDWSVAPDDMFPADFIESDYMNELNELSREELDVLLNELDELRRS